MRKTLILAFLLVTGFMASTQTSKNARPDEKKLAKLTLQYNQAVRDLKELELERWQLEKTMKQHQDKLKQTMQSIPELEKEMDTILQQKLGNIDALTSTATKLLADTNESLIKEYKDADELSKKEYDRYINISNVLKSKLDMIKK